MAVNSIPEMESGQQAKQTPFHHAIFPVLVLAVLIVYGLIIRPLLLQSEPLPDGLKSHAWPLDLIFILATAIAVAHLKFIGHKWLDIQKSIVAKLAEAMPAFLILFSIGLVIASWIVCGTIPMLVFWGLNIINPVYLYVAAFIASMIFSTLTGTSWGSVGTIGVVFIGMASPLEANMGATAGAVIGGAYFGDKMSPLSDTTNLAALATEVNLFDHINSMMYTTIPSATFAIIVYFCAGFICPPANTGGDMASVQLYLDRLTEIFDFNLLLLLPPLIVLVGSVKKMPTVPVLVSSVLVACLLAMSFQKFSVTEILFAVHKGFDVSLATWVPNVEPQVARLLEQGGLFALNEAIITAFMVFVFIGTMEHIRAMPTVVNRLMKSVNSARLTILASLFATAATNALTSNQYATSFIIGDAFKSKYDVLRIPRRVLSRSLEDTGTMIETLIPWTPATVFMVGTLGVEYSEYWYWQVLSLTNIVVATSFAATGFCCFLDRQSDGPQT